MMIHNNLCCDGKRTEVRQSKYRSKGYIRAHSPQFYPHTLWKNFSGKGCVIWIYQHNSQMVAYAALRYLPWVDDMPK